MAKQSAFQKIKPYVSGGLLALVIGLFIWYFQTHREDFSALRDVPIYTAALIVIMQIAIIGTNAVYLRIFLNVHKKKDSWLTIADVSFNSAVVNFFGFLQGGIGVRAYYLKKKHQMAYQDFGALLIANYWSIFIISSVLALLALLSQFANNTSSEQGVAVLFFTGTSLGLIMLLVAHKWLKLLLRKIKLERVFAGIQLLRDKPSLMASMLGTGLAQFTFSTMVYYLTLHAIGATPSLSGLLIYSAIAQFSILIALTPSAVGFREGLLILAQDSLGVTTSEIILSATLERVLYFMMLAAAGLYLQAHKRRAATKALS